MTWKDQKERNKKSEKFTLQSCFSEALKTGNDKPAQKREHWKIGI